MYTINHRVQYQPQHKKKREVRKTYLLDLLDEEITLDHQNSVSDVPHLINRITKYSYYFHHIGVVLFIEDFGVSTEPYEACL